jgi:hypothetical protein
VTLTGGAYYTQPFTNTQSFAHTGDNGETDSNDGGGGGLVVDAQEVKLLGCAAEAFYHFQNSKKAIR